MNRDSRSLLDCHDLLIKRSKIYPKKLGSYLMEMMVLRHEADYEPKHVGKRKCVEQICRARELIEHIAKEIKK